MVGLFFTIGILTILIIVGFLFAWMVHWASIPHSVTAPVSTESPAEPPPVNLSSSL